jgi:hypothetical protein
MTPAAPVHPQHHTWMGRHKFWTTMLVLLVVVALATLAGAIVCTIY